MEHQLKSLKVVDLKAILAKANVQVSSKANKTDLIAKITSSQPALDVYKSIYAADELLAPPEDVDWSHEQGSRAVGATQQPPTPAPILSTTDGDVDATKSLKPNNTTKTADTMTPNVADEDEETSKRRRRAERFGIPFVENPTSQVTRVTTQPPPDDQDVTKLEARAARFGITPGNGAKGSIDAEEEEKRRKRSERFGTLRPS